MDRGGDRGAAVPAVRDIVDIVASPFPRPTCGKGRKVTSEFGTTTKIEREKIATAVNSKTFQYFEPFLANLALRHNKFSQQIQR